MQWFSDPAWQSRIYSAVNSNSAVAVYNHNLRVCAVCKSIVSTYVHTTLRTFYTNYNYSLTTLHVERARSLSTFPRSTPDSGISNTLLLLKLLFRPFCTPKLLSVLWCQPLKSLSIEKLKNLSQKIAQSHCANRLQRWPSKLFKYKHLFDDNVGPRT